MRVSAPSVGEGGDSNQKRGRGQLLSQHLSGFIPQELNCPVWGSTLRLGQAAKKTRQCVIKGEIAQRRRRRAETGGGGGLGTGWWPRAVSVAGWPRVEAGETDLPRRPEASRKIGNERKRD